MKSSSAWIQMVVGLVVVVIGGSCGGEPVLWVHLEEWPEGAQVLQVQRWLDGVEYEGFEVQPEETGFAVSLAEGRSGEGRLQVWGMDGTGCKVAGGEVREQLGPALRVTKEQSVRLAAMTPARCPVEVDPRSGVRVVSEPEGINCQEGAKTPCQMEAAKGSVLSLSAVSLAAGTSVSWGVLCREVFDPSDHCELVVAERRKVVVERVKILRPLMRKLPTGTFLMGSLRTDPEAYSDEFPQHLVQIQGGFAMAVTEVTQRQYEQVMKSNPSYFQKPNYSEDLDRPVEQVSWVDAVKYCNQLSVLEGLPPCYQIVGETVTWPEKLKCRGYRLPMEAEWEYAARAGTGTSTKYAGSANADEVAWDSSNSGRTTHAVAKKKENGWGLYDLSGNVWEWVWDGYSAYGSGAEMNPTGPEGDGSGRVVRGGSWANDARYVRVACRNRVAPGYRNLHVGFRLARSYP